MSQRKYTNAAKRLEGKRSKELTSSSSMSQLSNSNEEILETFIHKPHKSDNLEK